MEIIIKEYLNDEGKSLFAKWFDSLDSLAAAKVSVALFRIEMGNLSNVKRIGPIYEYKIFFGPGYRIYFGKINDQIVLLLGGGSKKGQSQDIMKATNNWNDYKKRGKNESY